MYIYIIRHSRDQQQCRKWQWLYDILGGITFDIKMGNEYQLTRILKIQRRALKLLQLQPFLQHQTFLEFELNAIKAYWRRRCLSKTVLALKLSAYAVSNNRNHPSCPTTVTIDWHEPIVAQRVMPPSNYLLTDNNYWTCSAAPDTDNTQTYVRMYCLNTYIVHSAHTYCFKAC